MCGIAGFLSTKLNESDLLRMTCKVSHRGPDSEGYFFDEKSGIGLGHRRLSILDLSQAANQPFYSHNGRYVMIYNGEVYNFREVATKYGISPTTSSDSEVIIEAFAKVGPECFSDFNGMFSFCIWDKLEKRLYLVRDRIGIKPLYYYEYNGDFYFGSELKSIFELPIKREIDNDSVANFLYLGYIPGNSTIYQNCKKVRPGHYLELDKDGINNQQWWGLEENIGEKTLDDEGKAISLLDDLIQSSVQYCLISDVPLGVFLSGGVDSSLVAAVAQTQCSQPINTFSIAFEDKKFNEAPYARRVSQHIGSAHHEYTVTEATAIQLVDELLNIYDEPYADSSAIPTMMVSKLARNHVTVALSGDGGDELFMGYGFYYWARRLQNPFFNLMRKPIANVLKHFGDDRMVRAGKLFEYPGNSRRISHIFSQEQYYFSESEIDELLSLKGNISVVETFGNMARSLSWVERQSLFDIKNYLPEELLVKTDRASMVNSLEVRVPLLDHRLVEFAINLPEKLKLKGNIGKFVLKEVLYRYIPKDFFSRRKWGFAVPLSKWLKGELRYLLDHYLSKEVIEGSGLVNYSKVALLKAAYLGGKDHLYTRIWALIILHKWYMENHYD